MDCPPSTSEAVLYAPNKGASYGQALRPRRVRPAWEALQRFLSVCAVASPVESVRLIAYRATEWDYDAVSNDCIARVEARYGVAHRQRGAGRLWPSGKPLKGGSLEWDGSASTIEDMVSFLAAGEPWPKQTVGPVELQFFVSFLWRDPHSADVLPDQIERSNMLVTLSRRHFVQPSLWFPFAEGAPAFSEFLRHIQPLLPFTLLPRHFRVATPTATESRYRFRKFVTPLPQTT